MANGGDDAATKFPDDWGFGSFTLTLGCDLIQAGDVVQRDVQQLIVIEVLWEDFLGLLLVVDIFTELLLLFFRRSPCRSRVQPAGPTPGLQF